MGSYESYGSTLPTFVALPTLSEAQVKMKSLLMLQKQPHSHSQYMGLDPTILANFDDLHYLPCKESVKQS